MFFVGNIREVHRNEYDKVYAIMRSDSFCSDWIFHNSNLSPSWDLFNEFRRLKANNLWNKDSFNEIYVPRFLKEISSYSGVWAMQHLLQEESSGKSIALVCTCKDEELCHRSIVAGLLQGMGYDVRLNSGKDYSKYYNYVI